MTEWTSLRAQSPVRSQKPFSMLRWQPIMVGVSLLSILLLTMLVLALPGRAADTPGYSYARIVRLSYVEGDVQIVRADKSNKWEPAAMNMPVEQGFALGTNLGRAEVEFENGSMLWLAPNSVVQFTELALSNGGRITRITLSEGVASFDANLSAGDTFEVSSPLFSVTPNKNTEFRMGVRGKTAGVSVLKGRVTVGAGRTTQEVAKGAMFVEEAGKPPKVTTMKSPATDQWDHWVDSRLTAERNGATEAALNTNAPFTYGMADLADYGSWSLFPGFGYGWQPWGMTAGWAPFMDGQWMFYPTFGWAWISSEPWGWVPYHFGNWEFSPTFGWMWIPGNYGLWDAAPVEWYSVGGRIGWTPRGIRLPRTTSIDAPVIVGTKKLGKEGRNQVFSAAEVSAKMQSLQMSSLAMAPAKNGKPSLTAGRVSTARVVIPTAENLETLRAGLPANAGASVRINALREAVPSRAEISRFPEPGFTAVNAASAAPRIPNRPPMHVMYATPRMGQAEPSGPISTLSAPSMAAPRTGPVAMPAASAHPTSAGTGRPR
jgi:hypothetical protein